MQTSSHRVRAMFAVAAMTLPVCAQEGVDQNRAREAAARSIAALQKTQDEWKFPCLSSHHQSLPAVVYSSARRHGVAVDEERVRAHAARTFRILSGYESLVGMPLDAFAFGYTLLALEGSGIQADPAAAIAARRFALSQEPDGHWGTSDARPPHSYSIFASSALAVRAISRHLPDRYAGREELLKKALTWFRRTQAVSTEDSTFRLLGTAWAEGGAADVRDAAKDLLARQLPDGGWPQVAGTGSDAYSTGEALYALRQSGVLAASNEHFRRAIAFLLNTQAPDGSWLVRTRLHSKAQISPPFFDSGFPGGNNQFISCAGTSWATLALLEALPETAKPATPLSVPEAEPRNPEPWFRTALFGTRQELQRLLDNGLDARTASRNGVTLLMLAAPDPARMSLVLERGGARTLDAAAVNGATALKVAASYRYGSAALQLLLERGAKLPEDDALVSIAAGAGDVDSVRLLIARGAYARFRSEPPQRRGAMTPLMSAVMSDRPEIVRVLAKAGADVNAKDENGMTALIWAAVTHKTELVSTLLSVGADPSVVSNFGGTALDHTTDIRLADSQTAAVLRAALRDRWVNAGARERRGASRSHATGTRRR